MGICISGYLLCGSGRSQQQLQRGQRDPAMDKLYWILLVVTTVSCTSFGQSYGQNTTQAGVAKPLQHYSSQYAQLEPSAALPDAAVVPAHSRDDDLMMPSGS